jgi:hypothetical protein
MTATRMRGAGHGKSAKPSDGMKGSGRRVDHCGTAASLVDWYTIV